jgi:hypothetical protein
MQPLQIGAWVLLLLALAIILTTLGVSLAVPQSTSAMPPEVTAALAAAPTVQRSRENLGKNAHERSKKLAKTLAESGRGSAFATAVPYEQYPARNDPVVMLKPRTPEDFLQVVDTLKELGLTQLPGKADRPAFAWAEQGAEIWVQPPGPQDVRSLQKTQVSKRGRAALGALEHLFGAVFYPVFTSRKCVAVVGGPPCAAPAPKSAVALATAPTQCPAPPLT